MPSQRCVIYVLHGLQKNSFVFYRKNRYKSANGQPASRMNTCTAERPFALKMILIHLITVTVFFPWLTPFSSSAWLSIPPSVYPRVRRMREPRYICGFCGRVSASRGKPLVNSIDKASINGSYNGNNRKRIKRRFFFEVIMTSQYSTISILFLISGLITIYRKSY